MYGSIHGEYWLRSEVKPDPGADVYDDKDSAVLSLLLYAGTRGSVMILQIVENVGMID